jgi:hypothetical protein
MTNAKKPAGKTRGRPALQQGATTVPVNIRMTETQRDKLLRLGMDGGPALLVALPVWAAMAAGFVRAMKGTPAPRRA